MVYGILRTRGLLVSAVLSHTADTYTPGWVLSPALQSAPLKFWLLETREALSLGLRVQP